MVPPSLVGRFIETGSGIEAAGREKWGVTVEWAISVWYNEKVLEMDSDEIALVCECT